MGIVAGVLGWIPPISSIHFPNIDDLIRVAFPSAPFRWLRVAIPLQKKLSVHGEIMASQ
jgi:hypothetical protein